MKGALIRVLTVDEHQLVQEGLAAIINHEPDMAVIANASNGAEAINAFRDHRPDVLTIDLTLPDMPGEEVARRIRSEFSGARIVIENATTEVLGINGMGGTVKDTTANLRCDWWQTAVYY